MITHDGTGVHSASRGPSMGQPIQSKLKPRGPPPTSPYGMMNTPPSSGRPGSTMNTPLSQRGPPGGNSIGNRGPVPRGPPPRGPPPRNFPPGGTPKLPSRVEAPAGYSRTPNTSARAGPDSGRSPHLQGIYNFHKNLCELPTKLSDNEK